MRQNTPKGTRIQICTFEEQWLGEFGDGKGTGDDQFMVPVAIDFDSNDLLYVTDEVLNEIKVFDSQGNFVKRWGSAGSNGDGLAGPSGIAVDRDDNLYVVERDGNLVHKLTPDGESLLRWGEGGTGEGQFNMPWGVGLDSQGNVYVPDWRNERPDTEVHG